MQAKEHTQRHIGMQACKKDYQFPLLSSLMRAAETISY